MKKIVFLLILLFMTSCGTKETLYYVDNDFFELEELTINNFICAVDFKCEYQLEKAGVIISFYNSSKLVGSYTSEKELESNSGTILIEINVFYYTSYEVCFYGYSSQYVDNIVELETDNSIEVDQTFTVIYHYNNSYPDKSVNVTSNSRLSVPDEPTKEGYIFIGWYKDSDFTYAYDFESLVTSNLNLYARYIIDDGYLTNQITLNKMSGILTLYNKSYTGYIGTNYSLSSGTAVVYKYDGEYYYAISNAHVVGIADGYTNQSFYVKTYTGKEYDVELMKMDATYDLSVIRFKTTDELNVFEYEETNPIKGEDVVALGQPLSQTNAITFGKISNYTKISLSTEYSKVTFDVISHSAYTNNGSSGGALLNQNLKLIGINFATSETVDTGEYIRSFSIPIEKVIEFLTLNSL